MCVCFNVLTSPWGWKDLSSLTRSWTQSWQWKHSLLTIRLPGNSPKSFFFWLMIVWNFLLRQIMSLQIGIVALLFPSVCLLFALLHWWGLWMRIEIIRRCLILSLCEKTSSLWLLSKMLAVVLLWIPFIRLRIFFVFVVCWQSL